MNYNILKELVEITFKAGKEILSVYECRDSDFHYKNDKSPVTIADKLSNQIIIEELSILTPDIPIVTEENDIIDFSLRKNWELFWLVDPLDGTKEFIHRNGEFTVNIGLIEKNKPTLGVVYLPVKDTVYFGDISNGAFKLIGPNFNQAKKIHVAKKMKNNVTIVGSRSHPSLKLQSFVKNLANKFDAIYELTAGSSLKFCLLLEGIADVYPRFGNTCEWDTAAAHAILRSTGCNVYDGVTHKQLTYNKPSLKNNFFYSCNEIIKKEVIDAWKHSFNTEAKI